MTYAQPFFPLLLILSIACLLFPVRFRWRWLTVSSAAALFLFSWQPFASLFVFPFEHPYPEESPRASGVQAIVVLSSSVLPPIAPPQGNIPGSGTYLRCLYAAWLRQNAFAVPILASGGGSSDTPYAVVMRGILERQGVPASMIWTEETSRSTYENALYSAPILRQKGIHRIALVTEAFHMARAERCFRKQGFDVIPAACGFRAMVPRQFSDFLPSSEAISFNEDTMHETIGMIWYALLGRI